MTSFQLMALRFYMLTLGRFAFFAAALRKILVSQLIRRKSNRPYGASADFFSVKDLA